MVKDEGIIDMLRRGGVFNKTKDKDKVKVKKSAKTKWCKICDVKLGKNAVQFKDGWYCKYCGLRKKVKR